jgi:DNA-binding MltR family transcriptional regulator
MKHKLSDKEIERIKGVQNLRKLLEKESDRGCCLLAVSFLDNELKLLLEEKLIGDAKFKNNLFDVNGPLGNFSSKINLSFSIGVICNELKNDINVIRKIRNEFGHNYTYINFDSAKIKSQILALTYNLYDKSETTPRVMFINTVTLILSEIHDIFELKNKFKEIPNKSYIKVPALVKLVKKIIENEYDK